LPFSRHPRVFDVVYQRLIVGTVFKGIRSHRTDWQCAICDQKLDYRADIVKHSVFTHFIEACRLYQVVAPAILSVGFVPDHSSKSHLPWRVDAPEYR
jgi:hypothetical protein